MGHCLERALALPILLRLRLDIPAEPMKRTQDDEEFAVSTYELVDLIQQSRQEGRDEGFAEALLELYADRFGAPPPELTAIVTSAHDRSQLRAWLKIAACGSVEEVLSAIRGQTAS